MVIRPYLVRSHRVSFSEEKWMKRIKFAPKLEVGADVALLFLGVLRHLERPEPSVDDVLALAQANEVG